MKPQTNETVVKNETVATKAKSKTTKTAIEPIDTLIGYLKGKGAKHVKIPIGKNGKYVQALDKDMRQMFTLPIGENSKDTPIKDLYVIEVEDREEPGKMVHIACGNKIAEEMSL